MTDNEEDEEVSETSGNDTTKKAVVDATGDVNEGCRAVPCPSAEEKHIKGKGGQGRGGDTALEGNKAWKRERRALSTRNCE